MRPASTAFTGGAGNPVLSLGEDSISTVLSFAAVIVPVVAFLLVVVLFTLFIACTAPESPAGRTPDAAGPAAAPRPGATTFPQNEQPGGGGEQSDWSSDLSCALIVANTGSACRLCSSNGSATRS